MQYWCRALERCWQLPRQCMKLREATCVVCLLLRGLVDSQTSVCKGALPARLCWGQPGAASSHLIVFSVFSTFGRSSASNDSRALPDYAGLGWEGRQKRLGPVLLTRPTGGSPTTPRISHTFYKAAPSSQSQSNTPGRTLAQLPAEPCCS